MDVFLSLYLFTTFRFAFERNQPSFITYYSQLRKQSTLKMSPQLVSLRNEFTTTSKIGQKETYLLLDAESFWWIPLEVAEDVLREK